MLIINVCLICALIVCAHADLSSDSQQCLNYVDYTKPITPENTIPAHLEILGETIVKGKMKIGCDTRINVKSLTAINDGGSLPYIKIDNVDLGLPVPSIPFSGILGRMDLQNFSFVTYHLRLRTTNPEPVLLIRLFFYVKETTQADHITATVYVPVFIAKEHTPMNELLDDYLRQLEKPGGKDRKTHPLNWLQEEKAPITMKLHYSEVFPLSTDERRFYDYYANCQYVSADALKHVFQQFDWINEEERFEGLFR